MVLIAPDKVNRLPREWLRVARHNLANELLILGRHAQTLPLLDRLHSRGAGNGYGAFMHAVAVWKVSADRQRTLDLLRTACAADDRDLTQWFLGHDEFGAVKDDPEFLQSIRRQ